MRCGRETRDYETWYSGSSLVCYDCYQLLNIEAQRKASEEAKKCASCGHTMPIWAGKDFKGRTYCEGCFSRVQGDYVRDNSCKRCGKLFANESDKKIGPKNTVLCAKCYEDARTRFSFGTTKGLFCPECGNKYGDGHVHDMRGVQICESCFKKVENFQRCSICGKQLGIMKALLPNGTAACPDCARKIPKKR
jgi:formylmethanofuran dehydrogenase subunit E